MSHCAMQCPGQAEGSVQADQPAVAGVVGQLGGEARHHKGELGAGATDAEEGGISGYSYFGDGQGAVRCQYDLAKIRQSLLCSSEKIRVFGDFCKGHSWISQPKTKFKESSRKLGGRCRSLLNDLVT